MDDRVEDLTRARRRLVNGVISLKCVECSSSRLRRSRLRLKDLERLLLLQYPIRCRRCHRRDYVGLQRVLWQARNKATDARQKA